MPCSSKNFQHIRKILRASVDNLVLKIALKFQVDRIKIVSVLLLAELNNSVLKKTRLKFSMSGKKNFVNSTVTCVP